MNGNDDIQPGQISNKGFVFYDAESVPLGFWSSLIYGYGHTGSPPFGWGSLAPRPLDNYDCNSLSSVEEHIWLVNVPFLGRLRIVKDTLGLVQSAITFLIWLYCNWSTLFAILIPRYLDGSISPFIIPPYLVLSGLCIASFIRVSTLNPGPLKFSEIPQGDWTQCHQCLRMRPPQTHHCKRCAQCVQMMDHHCTWINNCVGKENRSVFLFLIFYTFLLSFCIILVHVSHSYWLGPCRPCENQEIFATQHRELILKCCFVVTCVMFVSSIFLLVSQHISVVSGFPTVELFRRWSTRYKRGTETPKNEAPRKTLVQAYSDIFGEYWSLWPFPGWKCKYTRPRVRSG